MAVSQSLAVVYFIILICSTANGLSEGDECKTPMNQTGLCTDLKNCKELQILLKKSLVGASYVRQSTCGYNDIYPLVCCPTSINSRITDISKHPNIALLPKSCGDFEENRIYGGEVTGIFDFPWMALISYKSGDESSFRCGGTIINEKYILTAAHCVTNLKDKTIDFVRINEHDLRTKFDCEGPEYDKTCITFEDVPVEEVIPHPGYTRKDLHDDIGLIRLQKPIDILRNASAICLPITESLRNFDINNKNGTVTGWGKTENSSRSEILLKVQLPIVEDSKCAKTYATALPNGISNNQFCAGGLSKVDSCSGDSGGPLMIPKDDNSGRLIQYGVVSFGPKQCGTEGRPAVFTRISNYMTWILDNMKI